ncbi:MAG: biotin--[acetyl-CoA-carboxylase] ligase, partial [Candidatus Rokubacteria bacterium]|nr:biotin--[acetyl-CoA-carboxylase] ligase [Candidatus Rokubacteria bacterium]
LTEAIWAEGLPAAIKWPNDVLVEGKKVAGSLVECAARGDRVEYVILGVGVNVNVGHAALRTALGEAAHAATSLREAAGRAIDRNSFTVAFLALLDRWFRIYTQRGPDAVLAPWRDRDIVTGRRVQIREDGEAYEGRALGVNREGRLVVEEWRGVPRQVIAGEVRLLE